MKAKKFTEKDLKFADKSLDVLRDFIKYALRKPQVLDDIPSGSYVALLPKTDISFSKINEKIVSKFAKKTKAKFVTFIGEKTKKVAVGNLVFLKGVILNNKRNFSANKEKLSNWHN